MTEDEFDQARNDVLAALIAIRNETGHDIWLDRRMLQQELEHTIGTSDLVAVVGSLAQMDYVQIDRDLKPRERLADFSDIKLTSAGTAFFDSGRRFVVNAGGIGPNAQGRSLPKLPQGFALTERSREQVVDALRKAEADIMLLQSHNADRAQAHGYITAARILAETPDPPIATIWDLLDRANSIAGIASLLVAVIALFLAK